MKSDANWETEPESPAPPSRSKWTTMVSVCQTPSGSKNYLIFQTNYSFSTTLQWFPCRLGAPVCAWCQKGDEDSAPVYGWPRGTEHSQPVCDGVQEPAVEPPVQGLPSLLHHPRQADGHRRGSPILDAILLLFEGKVLRPELEACPRTKEPRGQGHHGHCQSLRQRRRQVRLLLNSALKFDHCFILFINREVIQVLQLFTW